MIHRSGLLLNMGSKRLFAFKQQSQLLNRGGKWYWTGSKEEVNTYRAHTVQLFFGAAVLRLFSHSVDQNSCWTEGQSHRSTVTCHCIKRLHTDQRWSACVQMLINLFGSNNAVLLQVQTHHDDTHWFVDYSVEVERVIMDILGDRYDHI